MKESRPSTTAFRVALRRAAHQIFDDPKVFDDPVAIPILGSEVKERLKAESRLLNGLGRSVRAAMAARSRYAEDQLARAVERGTKQYVILGAGFDTFAYRNKHAARGLRVFEVDHPATQEWKRRKLMEAQITIPSSVTFVSADFEVHTPAKVLAQAGFDAGKPAFFSWLGVTMYLDRDVVTGTLRFMASCAPGGGAAFDYMVPRESLQWRGRLVLAALSRRVAQAGEPFRTFFAPEELRSELAGMGFHSIEDLGKEEIDARYFKDRADGLRVPGLLGRLMSAEV